VAVFVGAPLLFPREEGQQVRRRFDALGAAGVTAAALGVIYAALAVPEFGLLSLPTALGGGVAVTALVVLVLVERRAADPVLPLALFRSRSVAIGVGASLLGGSARATSFFLVALYLQQLMKLEPGIAGLAMVPTSLAGFAVSIVVLPRILKALGPERSVVIGLVVLALGHLWLARVPLTPDYTVDVLPALLLIAAGVALSFTPSTMVIASGIPSAKSGLASGLSNSSSQIGAAIGVAVLGAILVSQVAPGGAAEQSAVAAGFSAAFTTAAALALAGAALASVLLFRGRDSEPLKLTNPAVPPARAPRTSA
jgi:predicted MFS family arabinose efflux permease